MIMAEGLEFKPSNLTPPEGVYVPTLSFDAEVKRLDRRMSDVFAEVTRVGTLVEGFRDSMDSAAKAFDRAQDRMEKSEERLFKLEERLTEVEVKFAAIAERYGKIMAGTAGGGVLALLANAVTYYLAGVHH